MINKKILLFGGSFNPVTIAHLLLAQTAKEAGKFDKCIFIPCGNAPHKNNLIDFKHRLNMINMAIRNIDGMEVSDYEGTKTEKSYTLHTYQHFLSIYPNPNYLWWFIGGDTVSQLPTWFSYEQVKKHMRFFIANRPGYQFDSTEPATMGLNYCIHNLPLIQISSTDVRERVYSKKDIKFFVPESVENYIKENSLFKEKVSININNIQE